jgi:Domain of unknown function (DUF4360)
MAWGRLSNLHDRLDDHQTANTIAGVSEAINSDFDMDHHDHEDAPDQQQEQQHQQRSLLSVDEPTWFGSGCENPNSAKVTFRASADREIMKVSFTNYDARTTNDELRDYKSCNMALPLQIPARTQVGVEKVDYYGWATVPPGTEARLDAEHFFAGSQGPTTSQTFGERSTAFNGKVHVAESTQGIAWSECGPGATNFRINTSLTASKPNRSARNAVIMMDRAQVDGVEFIFRTRRC